jgi:hypothetical protein
VICRTGEPFHKTDCMSFLFLWNTKTVLRCCAGENRGKPEKCGESMLRRNPLHDRTTSSRRPFGSCTYCHNVSRALMVDRYPGNPEYRNCKWWMMCHMCGTLTCEIKGVIWPAGMCGNIGPTLCHSFYISCCWLLPSLTEDRLVVLRLSVAAAGTPTGESS